MNAPPVSRPRLPDIAALAIVLLALTLSLIGLASQSLWTDEGMAHFVAGLPVADQLRLLRDTAPNPLHYLMLSGWMRLAGETEFALRFLSALGSALTVALVYRLGRDLGGRRAGLIAAGLLAVNPLRIYYAQEARAYAWLTALVAASALLLWRSPRGLSAVEVIALGLLQALTCLAHPYGAFVLVALNLVIFARLLRAPRAHIARWALSGIIAAALAGAWFGGALGAIGGSAGSAIYFRGRLPIPAVVGDALQAYVTGQARLSPNAGAIILVAALVAGLLALLFARDRWPWLFILVGCIAPVAGILLLSGDRERYASRYVIPGLLFCCLLVGQFSALSIVRRRAGALAYGLSVGALAAFMIFGAWRQFTDPALARPDFRAVSEYIRQHGDPARDAVVIVGGHFAPVMRYYLGEAGFDLVPMPLDLIQNVDKPLRYAGLSALNDAAADRDRFWLALWQRELADPGGIVLDQLLRRGARQEVAGDFGEINLLLFDIPPGTTFETDPQPANPTGHVWGDALALEGFDLAPSAPRAGDTLDVTLHWLPLAAIGKDYLASVQLIGPDGKLYAQADHMAHSDFYPTSLWRAGEAVLDRYAVTIPPETPPGDYLLQVVLYDRDGARWLVDGQETAPLTTLRIAP